MSLLLLLINLMHSWKTFFSIYDMKYEKHQISILEWCLKDHVTLKTGVMMLKIHILTYFNIKTVILHCNNISQLLFRCCFYQVNAALVSLKDFFQNI